MKDKKYDSIQLQQEKGEEKNVANRKHFEMEAATMEWDVDTAREEEIQSKNFIPENRLENNREMFFSEKESGTMSATAAASRIQRIFLVISWVCAACTAFISPYFVIPGVLFGALTNRLARGSGNAAIITNIVFAVVNLLFSLFLVYVLRRVFI